MTTDQIEFARLPKSEDDWAFLAEIFGAVLGHRDAGRLRKAFEVTTCRRFAYLGERLVGAGRIITDGLYYGLLVDVVVDPDRQRAKVGTRLVKTLLADSGVPLVLAQSVPSVVPFYEKIGFHKMLTGMAHYTAAEKAVQLGYVTA